MYWIGFGVVCITLAMRVRSKLKDANTQTDDMDEIVLREMLNKLLITEPSESMSICDSSDGREAVEIDYNYIKT